MTLEALVDNDVIMKLALFRLLPDLLRLPEAPRNLGILGVARFVIGRRLARIGDVQVTADFVAFLDAAQGLEPSNPELALATELEEYAAVMGVELDVGESQLLAIAVLRGQPTVVTGDKRAIAAAAAISSTFPELLALCGRIVCLEQLIMRFCRDLGEAEVRSRICQQPAADTALRIAFSCSSPDGSGEVEVAVQSYVESIRATAASLLYPGLVAPAP